MSGSGRQAAPTFAWPAFVVALSIPALYYLQSQSADMDSLYRNFGLMPYVVEHGEVLSLATSILLHGNWAHALMNAVFALGFGLPVARLMGTEIHHGVSYILFYIFCGIAANLVYVGLHPGSFVPLIGASGAVSGLMGGTARLIGPWAALFGKRSIAEARALPPMAPRPEERVAETPEPPAPVEAPIENKESVPAPAPDPAPQESLEPERPVEPL